MANKWLTATQYRKVYRFLGPKVVRLFIIGLLVGLSLFAVEIGFAYGLQAFLQTIGVMSAGIATLPAWIPQANLHTVLLFILAIGTTRCVLQWSQLYLQGAASEELRFRQRNRVLKWAFNSESASSSQVTVLVKDRTDSAGSVIQNLQTLIIQITAGLLLGVALFVLSPRVTLMVGVVLCLLLFPMRWFDRKIGVSGRGLNEESERISRRLLTSIKNLLLMRIYGTQHAEEAKAYEGSVAIRKHHLVFYGFSGLKYVVPQIAGLAMICFIAVLGRSTLGMAPGLLVSYFYLFMRFMQTFSAINLAASSVIHFWPQSIDLALWWADHSFDGVRNTRTIDEAEVSPIALATPIGWTMNDVAFTYPGSREPLFKDFNLSLDPGKTLVVTGPSGAGKSTLLGLLLGGVSPTQGRIEAVYNDGVRQPLESFRPHLHRRVGYVGAESFLIEGSVYQNIVYGLQSTPTSEELNDALKKAECHFVFDMGLDHLLTEQGQGLSAGQKQRISLARALLRKPKVLILDEATANLDVEMEAKLVDTLANLKGQMTIVAVTHRQALLKIADQHLILN